MEILFRTTMIDRLIKIIGRDISHSTFKDHMYTEDLFKESIKENFAGWYNPADIRPYSQFIIKQTSLPRRAKVLDVACGHGKYSEFFQKKGHNVTGVDISATLIRHLNKKYNGRITFRKIPMERISFNNNFDLVMVLGNSLSLVPASKANKSLHKFQLALKNKGRLFLELDNRNYYIQHEANTSDWGFHQNRWLILSEHLFNRKSSLELGRDICLDVKNNSVKEHVMIKRLYTVPEITNLVQKTGFSRIRVFGDWQGHRFNKRSAKIILIAEKT